MFFGLDDDVSNWTTDPQKDSGANSETFIAN
jgi:hypothetical protein